MPFFEDSRVIGVNWTEASGLNAAYARLCIFPLRLESFNLMGCLEKMTFRNVSQRCRFCRSEWTMAIAPAQFLKAVFFIRI
jgi:hypothetical protein